MSKEIPVLFRRTEECCGCTACYAVCPVEAIEMKFDSEGFLYPFIDTEKCICCHRCVSVCDFKKRQKEKKLL